MGVTHRVCRVCGRQWEFADGYEWLQAVPDGLSGRELRENVQWWCSRACRDRDPQYEPLPDGEALLQMINRLKAGTGLMPGDVGDAYAQATGQSRQEIERIADKILAELQGHDDEPGPRQLRLEGM
jgi:hypothetical protein